MEYEWVSERPCSGHVMVSGHRLAVSLSLTIHYQKVLLTVGNNSNKKSLKWKWTSPPLW